MNAITCPVCRSLGVKQILTSPKLKLYRCSSCGAEFVGKQIRPGRKTDDYFDAYSLQKYVSYYKAFRQKIFKENWNIIRRFIPGGKAIDIGASFGWFIECAPESWKVMGVDESKKVSAFARFRGVPVITGTERILTDKTSHFDLITLHNVFEHLPSPLASLRVFHKALKKDGMVVITVPNGKGLINRCVYVLAQLHIYKPVYTLFQVESASPHLFYYNSENLTHLLTMAGFTPRVTRGQPIIDIDNIDRRMAVEGISHPLGKLVIKVGLIILYHASVLLNMPDEMVIYASKMKS